MALTEDSAAKLSALDAWFTYHMPYAFQHLPNFSGHVWLPVNRIYKPLGQLDKTHVDYDAFHTHAVRFARDPKTFSGIWYGPGHPDVLYLYDDGRESRIDYFMRLEKLFGYTLKLTAEAKTATGVRFAD